MLRLILNSVLKASTLSPFKIRWAMALRNSTLNTRTAIRTSVRCSLSLFSVSQVWGPDHVAPTEVNGQGDTGMPRGGKAGVVGVERSGEHLGRINTKLFLHPGSPLRIQIIAV